MKNRESNPERSLLSGFYKPGIVDPADIPHPGPIELALRRETPDDGSWDFLKAARAERDRPSSAPQS